MAKRRGKRGVDPGTQPFSFALPDVQVVIPNISELPSWRGVKRLGYDVETKDQDIKDMGPGVRRPDCRMVGLSFAFDDGPDYYIPLSHEGGDNVPDPEQALRYVRDNAKEYDGDVVGMNLGYEIDWSGKYGIVFPKVRRWRDVQNADVLLDELQQKYTLEAILERHAFAGKEEDVLKQAARAFGYNPKGDLWRMPGRYAVAYGRADSRKPLGLERLLAEKLEAQGLTQAYDIESRLLPILVKWRQRGVRVSLDRLEEVERWALQQEALACDEVVHRTGVRFGVGQCMAPKALMPILNHINFTPPLTETGKPSLAEEVLEQAGPIGDLILRARRMFKLRNTYTNSLRRYAVDHGDEWRIHCTINQMARESDAGKVVGARWGRMSSSNPNLQNQPRRDPEIGVRLRRCFLPDAGGLWGSNDFSRQEPRLIGHYAILCKSPGWEEVDRRYRENPNLDDHQMMSEMTGLKRDYAKNIFMGLCYGEGEVKLSHECGFPTEWVTAAEQARIRGWSRVKGDPDRMVEIAGPKGREVFETFHDRAPFVRDLTKRTQEGAEDRGFVRLLDGRKCRFPLKSDGRKGYDWTHLALNRVIQGGAAVQTKLASIAADEAGHYLQLAIHDDLTGTVQSPDESAKICHLMENVIALKVPSKVEYKVGPSWGELK